MILRDYQDELSLRTRQALVKYRKVLLNLATGGGKTVIAADIFSRAVRKDIKPVFLTDRIEIALRTKETLEEFGLKVQLVTKETKVLYKSDCYVAMAETFYRRCVQGWFPISSVKLLFCDECHMSVFNKSIELFTTAYICGMTATPVSKSFNLNKIYDKIIVGASNRRLIEGGYLCPSVDIGQEHFLELNAERGEFTQESQRNAFTLNHLNEKCISLWRRHARDRSTICFNINIDHSLEMEKEFKKIGISCAHIDGKTPEEDRVAIMKAYRSGEIQVLLNVDIATKGTDLPITSCIIENFSTMSMTKHFQAVGRGGRLYSGKKNFINIDIGNNRARFGSFNDEVDWEYIFNNPEEDIKNTKPAPKKLCSVCYAYIENIHLPECPVCYTKIDPRKLIDLKSQMPKELMEKDVRDMNFKELQAYGKFTGKKNWNGWAWFQAQNNNKRNKMQGKQFNLFQ